MEPVANPEDVKQAEALVHLLRDLSTDADEVLATVRSTPRHVRLIARALMQQPQGES